jgi:hypothetical protein
MEDAAHGNLPHPHESDFGSCCGCASRRACPVGHSSPKNSSAPGIAMTLSFPCSEIKMILTRPGGCRTRHPQDRPARKAWLFRYLGMVRPPYTAAKITFWSSET